MLDFAQALTLVFGIFILPPVLLGLIRKTKARLQNRIGAPVLQPLFDLLKLARKGETISATMSWIFRSTAALNLSIILLMAVLLPWTSFKPHFYGVDLFLVLYAFAAARFFTLLASMDAGSAFGAFAASREMTLALLLEPAAVLGFAALAVSSKTSDLGAIFTYVSAPDPSTATVWILAGLSILLGSLVELSRMPIDDPTTHLELTMVHEAMILEASGRNLALIEYGQMLKMTLLFGLSIQCFMHSIPATYQLSDGLRACAGFVAILALGAGLGCFEVLSVKLRWSKNPDFIAYSLTMSLLACFMALGGGVVK